MRTVLITGGSGGIGLAISDRFAARGDRLLWVARTQAELDAGAVTLRTRHPGVLLDTLAQDLVAPGAADAVYRWTEDLGHPVDILVNNAGFGSWGFLDQTPEERDLAMFQLHMVVPYLLTRRYLPAMQARDAGHVVFMASSAGLVETPGFVAYGASKAFQRFFSYALGLELELEGSKVRTLCMLPAATRGTAFRSDAGMDHTDLFDTPLATTPDQVADDLMKALDRGRHSMVSGWLSRRLIPMNALTPRRVILKMMRPNLRR